MAYILITFIPCFSLLLAKDYGVKGHLFEIQEEDMRNFLQKKISKSDLMEMKEKFLSIQKKKALKPAPVKNLVNAAEGRIIIFDPRFTVDQDIKDNQGKTIVSKGTVVSPLKDIELKSSLIFFDATQIKQLSWAIGLKNSSKWILVKGDPLDLEERFHIPVYFDQQGFMIGKLGIKAIPAVVRQRGEVLEIEEVVLD